jgi:hypothetical protein
MKEYIAPEIIEYGPMTEITLGTGDGSFDDLVFGGNRIPTDVSCSTDLVVTSPVGDIVFDCN